MTIQKTWDLFYVPGYCVEVRATGLQANNRAWEGYAAGAVVGYFNDYASFAAAVSSLDKLTCKGIYIKCNPLKPELLARANNRLKGATFDNCAKETDVAARYWLRLDLDPVRASGISSTQEELQEAVALARFIVERMEQDGWGKGIVAISGNGADVLYKINLPVDATSKDTLRSTLAHFAERFNTPAVKVDAQLISAIIDTKVYGTVARKGDSTADRPHRRSQILDIPGEYKLVTDYLIKPQPKVVKTNQRSFNDTPTLAQVEEWLSVLPNPVGGYDEWINVLKSVHSAYPGDDGLALCEKYIPGTEGEVAGKWRTFHGNGVTVGTLIEYAKRNGWSAPSRTRAERYETNADESSTFDLNFGKPKEEPVSRTYAATDATMFRYVPKKDDWEEVTIADFVARISKVAVAENGSKLYSLSGNAQRGGRFTCEIDAEAFEDAGKLKAILGAAAGALDPIHAGQREHLNPAIKALSVDDIIYSRRYHRTGWADEGFLIPGHEKKGIEIMLPTKLAYSFSGEGDVAKGVQAIRHLINFMGNDVGPIVVGHIFTAPIAKIAGWNSERYGLFLRGRTGTHKTSVMQCLMSVYGGGYMNRENLIQWGKKFGSTINALMGYARHASDLPMLVDNYKPYSAEDARELISFIHAVMEGSDKDRLDRHSQLQEAKPFRCWPVFTGEDLPDSDAAALARLLTIQSRKAEDTGELTQAQQLAAHLPTAGKVWITWLESEQAQVIVKREAGELSLLRDEFAANIMANNPNAKNPYRIATNLATNLILWRILVHHPELGELAQTYITDHAARLGNLAITIAEQTSEAMEAQQLLARLTELIASGKVRIADKTETPDASDTIVGWRVSDIAGDNSAGVYLLMDASREAVRRLSGYDLTGFSSRTINDQLEELKAIGNLRDAGRKTKQIRINGARVLTIHITAKALFGEDDLDL